MKRRICVLCLSTLAAQASFGGLSDNARFRVQIVDELDGAPLNGMKIVGSFTERYPL